MQDLYEHQKVFLEKMPKRHLCCYDLGTGKTRLSIEWAKKTGKKPLIIVPKGLVDNWIRECEKWGLGSYTLITKEKFKAFATRLDKYDAIIIDEAHYFAGKSQLHLSLLQYVRTHEPEYIIQLTGTPYMRNALNVYRLGLLLGADKAYNTKNIWSWRYFDVTFFNRIRMGARIVPVQKDDDATKARLKYMVNVIGSTKHLSECVDVPKSQEYPEYVTKTAEQNAYILSMTDVEPIVRYTKMQQAMGGVVKGDAYKAEEHIPSNKVQRLLELAGSTNKLIVVSRFIHEIAMLEKALTAEGHPVSVIHGEVKDRDAILQKARAQEHGVIIVGSQISEGWEAPEFETMVFYSHSFSLKDYIQMKGRIQRINNLKPRCYIHLIAKDSVDEEVYQSILRKEDFLKIIYDKKRSGDNSTPS